MYKRQTDDTFIASGRLPRRVVSLPHTVNTLLRELNLSDIGQPGGTAVNVDNASLNLGTSWKEQQ